MQTSDLLTLTSDRWAAIIKGWFPYLSDICTVTEVHSAEHKSRFRWDTAKWSATAPSLS